MVYLVLFSQLKLYYNEYPDSNSIVKLKRVFISQVVDDVSNANTDLKQDSICSETSPKNIK